MLNDLRQTIVIALKAAWNVLNQELSKSIGAKNVCTSAQSYGLATPFLSFRTMHAIWRQIQNSTIRSEINIFWTVADIVTGIS